ncbi:MULTISPECIES: TerD family protein [unclassified Streptomyces]|uniref:TerD family protein n=1 Tax=unclassified Streptomyces TaxID=2593676 RepID=UPI000F6EE14F|nr:MULTISPECIES: TerD family protein [unclassified Streptomyces]AZM58165.1 stress protein [Streptomyces sp. WAC 01438]RSM99033.1 stress protein [Streptomyces sp. WAC 01420]
MASDQPRWWQPALGAHPDEALALEAAAGQQQRFAQLDALAARLLAAALAGRPVASVVRGTGPQVADSAEVLGLDAQEERWCAETFGVQEQQRRGAWYLPQKLSLKAGAVNLPHLVRQRPAHALTLAADDSAGVSMVDGTADAVLLWSVLVPLFEALIEPIRVRAAGPAKTIDDQRRLWADIEERYRLLGIAGDTLEAFRFGGGWHRLDRPGQQHARLRLLDALTAVDPLQLVTRHRTLQMQALMTGFAKKAKTGTALARRVLTRALQPVVSGYFAGDWLAVLDYLQAPPHPDEEVITALPEPRLYVGMSAQAAGMAAEAGIPENEIHAMLAAFLGGPTSLSPVEERVAALRDWWTAFDQTHAVQRPGMRPLWGLVDENVMVFSWQDKHGFTQQLYRQVLPASVNEQVDRLWQSVTLQRHAKSIVSNPLPHHLMAEALGPALEFWHGVALTAWFVCEGPYSRAPLSGVADYYSRPLTALRAAGCPVAPGLFQELRVAEQHLGPEERIVKEHEELPVETAIGSFIMTSSISRGSRREGFERVRDIITRHRRVWAEQYLDSYLQQRWRTALEGVAQAHHRFVAAKGRPPTLIQFAQFATAAANQWTGGDLGALYTAIGEPAPAQQERPARLLAGDGYEFARRVFAALGGTAVDDDVRMNHPEEAQRQWQLSRLASESLRYLQLYEALGQPPTAKLFGSSRLAWPWPGEEGEGWPLFQHTLASLTNISPPASEPAAGTAEAETAPGPPESTKHVLAKGANAPVRTESVAVRLITTGVPVDVSAVLLASNGKVRSDHDLVFYNHLHHDGVRTSGDTVFADLPHVPDDVHTVAVIASIDLEAQPTAVFDHHSRWRTETTQPAGTALSFEPAPFTSGETVAIVVEIYRHASGWKVRAVGQGYDTGLAGLAADYGIDVEP